MRVVVALGGNALQKRGEPMTVDNQRANVKVACEALAPVALEHELVITHGNGPQVGLLALQASSFDEESMYPFDVLGAQTQSMIGYFIEQELGNLLPFSKHLATLLTMTEVDSDDPAFQDPTKFVGPVYSEEDAKRLAAENGWVVKQDGDKWRRVVPSPMPQRIFQVAPVEWCLEKGAVVVCTGGGGIPTMYEKGTRQLVGVEAVIDKDFSSMVLARDIDADMLVIATDAEAVFVDFGTPQQKAMASANPYALSEFDFPAGSMGPKVDAAIAFAKTGKVAVIGALENLSAIMAGESGTRVSMDADGVEYYE
jgi:carbamate kinase